MGERSGLPDKAGTLGGDLCAPSTLSILQPLDLRNHKPTECRPLSPSSLHTHLHRDDRVLLCLTATFFSYSWIMALGTCNSLSCTVNFILRNIFPSDLPQFYVIVTPLTSAELFPIYSCITYIRIGPHMNKLHAWKKKTFNWSFPKALKQSSL